MATYFCCDASRRAQVRGQTRLNGIDFLEVVDQGAAPCDRQRLLQIHFVNPPDASLTQVLNALTTEHVRITGGERIRHVHAVGVQYQAPILSVWVNTPGDFSPYVLALIGKEGAPLPGMEARLSAVEFSFKVECPSDLDCHTARVCPPEIVEPPEIDYLAKDYASFRQLMLDRLSILLPQWQERNPADLGMALVELVAYVGDHLSYQQDAVATEAYLGTARRRESVRRHARLLDYFMHDGRNARMWVQVRVKDEVTLPKGTQLLTAAGTASERLEPGSYDYANALALQPAVFETMHEATLHTGYERLSFYTWGERACCLPAGATGATLMGKQDKLAVGDVLVLAEMVGPRTGEAADADPAHRHPVRLTQVSFGTDALHLDTYGNEIPVTELAWAETDALPFPLCISADTEDGGYVCKVSVALGNIVLADHGRTLVEPLDPGPVPSPDPRLVRVTTAAGEACDPQDPTPAPPRYRPRLSQGPLTMKAQVTWSESIAVRQSGGRASVLPRVIKGSRQRGDFNPAAPAAEAIPREMGAVLPAVALRDDDDREWHPQRDLLSSDGSSLEFAVEVDEAGRATLRFGDDEHGLRPAPGSWFTATYRVGNGTSGNIGADSLKHIVTGESGVDSIWNPLPARGGVDPERLEAVRQDAPRAFRVPQRAVTPDDYARMAERYPRLQRAAAGLRWTGSWHTVFLTADRAGGEAVEAEFEGRLRDHLEQYRMAGHDLEINGPRYVALEIELTVCVLPHYYRGDVEAALLEVFSNGIRPDGRRGFFHPDNFTFGQPVYLSAIYAEAQKVPGVRYVDVPVFQRLGLDSRAGLTEWQLPMQPLEIARLDNDPSFPEHGVLRLTMEGGR